MRKILVVGGGYGGFYTAWKLEKLRRDEAELTIVDPRPYMTYQPFLPEVMAGSVEARQAAVSLHPRGADSLHQSRKVNADRGDYSSPSRADVAHRRSR